MLFCASAEMLPYAGNCSQIIVMLKHRHTYKEETIVYVIELEVKSTVSCKFLKES